MRRLWILAALLLAAPIPGRAEPLRFIAFGDMPYCRDGAAEACAAEVVRVERLTSLINAARPAFSIYVGDTKGGSEACSDAIILRARDWMDRLDHPLLYTPGDNEWTDCWQARAGGWDQADRLRLVREAFFAGRDHLGAGRIAVQRQPAEQPAHATFVENARWAAGQVLFLTIHMPGSNNNRPTEPGERPSITPPTGAEAEFAARNAANLDWLRAGFAEAARIDARAVVVALQADLFFARYCGGYASGYRDMIAAIGAAAGAFGRPVLLINGDTHVYVVDQPVPEAPNLTRLMVPGDRDVQAVAVTIDAAADRPFRFDLVGEAEPLRERAPCAAYDASMRSTRSG